ncbi:MAG TPA: hypothetical protein VF817_01775 [Patescibacteria group bacterium]
MKAMTIEQRKAMATLIAILTPMAIIGVIGTICIPFMAPIAKVVYPLYDVALAYSIWWAHKNGGYKDVY